MVPGECVILREERMGLVVWGSEGVAVVLARAMAGGRGYGRGFGQRGVYPAAGGWYGPVGNIPYGAPYAMNAEEELRVLRDESASVQDELNSINRRIEEIEAKSSE